MSRQLFDNSEDLPEETAVIPTFSYGDVEAQRYGSRIEFDPESGEAPEQEKFASEEVAQQILGSETNILDLLETRENFEEVETLEYDENNYELRRSEEDIVIIRNDKIYDLENYMSEEIAKKNMEEPERYVRGVVDN